MRALKFHTKSANFLPLLLKPANKIMYTFHTIAILTNTI